MKVQIWVAAMEKQPPLSIKLIRDDNVDKPDDMVIQVMECLNEPGLDSPTNKHSIYKLPFFMRQTHSEAFNKAFDPQVVSFGPYHHGKKHLSPMERQKAKAFNTLKTRGLPVEAIVREVSTILDDLLESYDRLEEEWTQDPGKFLKLMIVDGCFMLRLFCDCPASLINMKMDIRLETLLLENQLPLKLLHKLHSIAGPIFISEGDDERPLQELICNWLGISQKDLLDEFLHILDLYKASLLCPPIDRTKWCEKGELSGAEFQVIPPATKLHEAGIKFKMSQTKSLKDVIFDEVEGVLSLPMLMVDDNTESTFLNVMAFEKLHVEGAAQEAPSLITSFVILMSNLIDDERDVALLSSKGTLANALGNDREAAELFSRLGKGVAMGPNRHMMAVHKMLNDYCKEPWNERCATLKHQYFQNPWTVISLTAAIFGFLILILQAIYQLLDYYKKDKKK
ncbi:UPF0481 protein At3g47200-like [Cucurbita moschata]|uniref:UPF0481 protein At3g47200-like n=1 Tax=Cucurbita moschata TaxID=3662 RepID=A0A6J1H6V9_CUCMO|nr:UPF0481 protein At3g47200-like [Cucurbita moschata]XP_022960232.1 UPF0481 protein At3g47200-like [Cucurbita moschata]